MLWIILLIIVLFGLGGIRIINQYEKGVVLTLGKYSGTRNAGLTWIFLGVQRMIKVDMRITTTDIPKQEVITKDNVPANTNAVVYFRVKSAEDAILNIQNYTLAIAQYAQAALRDVIGGTELDEILSEREKVSSEIQTIVESATKDWGIEVTDIKIQDIELPENMKRIMAKQAESERERRSVIIRAEGEHSAAQKLTEAARILEEAPLSMSIRALQTLEKLGPEPSKTIVFGIPSEFFKGMSDMMKSDETIN
jgi:regulator of protease activity HflC (stomatin/prohibitin superfamily)